MSDTNSNSHWRTEPLPNHSPQSPRFPTRKWTGGGDLQTQVDQLRQLLDSINTQFIKRTNALAAKTDNFFGFASDGSEALKPGM